MTSGSGRLNVASRPAHQSNFWAISGELDAWAQIEAVVGDFARADLPRVFVFLVRNPDVLELMPSIVGAIERQFGIGRPLSLSVIEEYSDSGDPLPRPILRVGLSWPGGVDKARHLIDEFDTVWDSEFEPIVDGRVLVNFDY